MPPLVPAAPGSNEYSVDGFRDIFYGLAIDPSVVCRAEQDFADLLSRKEHKQNDLRKADVIDDLQGQVHAAREIQAQTAANGIGAGDLSRTALDTVLDMVQRLDKMEKKSKSIEASNEELLTANKKLCDENEELCTANESCVSETKSCEVA